MAGDCVRQPPRGMGDLTRTFRATRHQRYSQQREHNPHHSD